MSIGQEVSGVGVLFSHLYFCLITIDTSDLDVLSFNMPSVTKAVHHLSGFYLYKSLNEKYIMFVKRTINFLSMVGLINEDHRRHTC